MKPLELGKIELLMCVISLCSITLSDSGHVGKVCEESHRALQGRPGPAESDGLHPERGAYNPPSHTRNLRSKTNALFKASKQETREPRSLRNFWLHWQFSTWHAKCYIDFLFSLGLLWDIALPSADAGTLIWVSPVGESQTGRKESTDHVAKSVPAAVCSPFSDCPLSLNAVDGTTTQTGLGICTSTAHLETPARSAAPFLTPAAPLSLERYL